MIIAKIFQTDDTSLQKDEWNQQLAKCCNSNIFSLYEWGEYKKGSWAVERICFFNETTFVGQAQILFKTCGPFRLGWCSSGINLTDYRYLEEIITSLEKLIDLKRNYIRFNFFDHGKDEIKFSFDEIDSLEPVKNPINSGYTINFTDLLVNDIDAKKYSKNNRYYLKKSLENHFQFEFKNLEAKTFCDIHDSMVENKNLLNLKLNVSDIEKLQSEYSDQAKMGLVSLNGVFLAACMVIVHKKTAYYYLAGSTDEGRKLSASFFMVDALLKELKATGVNQLDFGGITPWKKDAAGVNRFKMGFGGNVVNYVGERSLCKSFLLRIGCDYLISKKLG